MPVVLTPTLAGYMNGARDLTFQIGVVTCCQPPAAVVAMATNGTVIPGSRWYMGAVCNEAAMYSSEVILACHRRFQVTMVIRLILLIVTAG